MSRETDRSASGTERGESLLAHLGESLKLLSEILGGYVNALRAMETDRTSRGAHMT